MNNKKSIVALLLVAIIGIVGLTIAYFSNSTNVENLFYTKEYGTKYTETFESPTGWLPGDTTEKTIVAENTGQVDEAVRVSIEELWTPNDRTKTLTGWIHDDGTKSAHTSESELENDERAVTLNLANTSDWTYSNGYYYYKYKIAPGEKTNSFLESVTFNAKTKLTNNCTSTTSNGVTTTTCNSSGDDYDNATYKLTVTIETVQYNKYKDAWGTNVSIGGSKPKTIVDVLFTKKNDGDKTYDDGNKHELFPFDHPATGQLIANTDYRYIGNDPYNYVYFNCTDDTDTSTCEVWRIIGVFSVDDGDGNLETRVKLIASYLMPTNLGWASNGNNDWTNASLKNELNTTYYNSLSATAQGMIGDAKYYLSEVNISSWYGAEALYSQERKNTSAHSHAVFWKGKVGLMYLSDNYYTYGKGVDQFCYQYYSGASISCNSSSNDSFATKGWIFNSNRKSSTGNIENAWTIVPRGEDNRFALQVVTNGSYSNFGTTLAFPYRPVVYLNANVNIASGTGEATNPYVLQ